MSSTTLTKKCTLCRRFKALSEYGPSGRISDALRSYCNACEAANWKTCTGCHKRKRLADFWGTSKATGALHARCKDCQRKCFRAWALKYAKQQGDKKIPDVKRCSRCKKVKRADEFTVSRERADGLDHRCAGCKKILAAGYRGRRERGNRGTWDHTLWSKFRITSSDYERIFAEQRGLCAICERDLTVINKRRASVDHCHKTRKVRGLLCNKCNSMLAAVEREDFLERALSYLAKYK